MKFVPCSTVSRDIKRQIPLVNSRGDTLEKIFEYSDLIILQHIKNQALFGKTMALCLIKMRLKYYEKNKMQLLLISCLPLWKTVRLGHNLLQNATKCLYNFWTIVYKTGHIGTVAQDTQLLQPLCQNVSPPQFLRVVPMLCAIVVNFSNFFSGFQNLKTLK